MLLKAHTEGVPIRVARSFGSGRRSGGLIRLFCGKWSHGFRADFFFPRLSTFGYGAGCFGRLTRCLRGAVNFFLFERLRCPVNRILTKRWPLRLMLRRMLGLTVPRWLRLTVPRWLRLTVLRWLRLTVPRWLRLTVPRWLRLTVRRSFGFPICRSFGPALFVPAA
jgi:hypothetical protein